MIKISHSTYLGFPLFLLNGNILIIEIIETQKDLFIMHMSLFSLDLLDFSMFPFPFCKWLQYERPGMLGFSIFASFHM